MPKGARGCYACGKPTTTLVQVTLYDYPDGQRAVRPARSVRQTIADSAQRSYCAACVQPVIERVGAALERRHTATHGCRMCGTSPTVSRVQLWVRERESGTQRTVSSLSVGLCGEHRPLVYAAAIEPLDGSGLRRDEKQRGGTFTAARGSRLRPLGSK